MNKKHYVHLTDSDVKKLKDLIRNKSTTQTMAHRCHILLELDENHLPVSSYDHCVKEHGMCRSTVRNIVRRFALEGLDATLQYHRNKNSDNARRKVDGRMEATLIQIACGPVPEGNSHWTVSMLAKEMKIRFGEDAISRDTVSRTLKKTNLDLTGTNIGVSRP